MSPLGETSARTLETTQRASRKALIVLTVSLVVSVALNVLLARRVRSLIHFESARISDRLLKVGIAVPPIAAKRLGGQEEVISYQGTNRPTVLYIFTPPCAWCARNTDNLKALVNQRGTEYRFIGLSLSSEGLREYAATHGLEIPIYTAPSPDTRKAYQLGGTPQTIVVSPEGRVLQDWMGAYVGDQKSQVEAFFHVSLPGLRDLAKAEAAKN